MIKANYSDKSLVVDILSESFDSNKSVNYVVKQDEKRKRRIRKLMEYSFDVSYHFGEVYLSEDKKACALMILPDKKKFTLNCMLWDAKLVFSCIGSIPGIFKVLDRESKIKSNHPDSPIYHLWFIGVDPINQQKGIGSKLLKDIIEESKEKQRSIYLETSTLKNIPWYQKFGFEVFREIDLSYKLFLIKREHSK